VSAKTGEAEASIVRLLDEKFNGHIRQTMFEVISDNCQKTKSNRPIA
jgi:hypothetical protein